MRKWMVTLLAVTVVLTGCSAGEESSKSTNTNNTEQQAETTMEKEQAGKKIKVELDDFYFEPKKISVKSGKPTTLVLHNEGKKEHDFIIKKLDVHTDVAPGKTKKVTIKANKAGTYKIICEYHKNKGMTGKLIVK